VALGSTQFVTEMSTGSIACGEKKAWARADNLATFMCRLSRNSGTISLLKTSGPVQASKE